MIITSLSKSTNKYRMLYEGGELSLLHTTKINYEEMCKNLSKVLSEEEKIMYERLFRNKKRQIELYGGRLLAKNLIIENIGYDVDISDIKLIKPSDKSKPIIVINGLNVGGDISIAHNEHYVVAAYSKKFKVGVDIENIDVKLSESLIRYAFTIEEIKYWNIHKVNIEIKNIWVWLWTIKEAVSKAIGSGLNYKVDAIQIFMDSKKEELEIILNNKKISNRKMRIYCLLKDNNYISICSIRGDKNEV